MNSLKSPFSFIVQFYIISINETRKIIVIGVFIMEILFTIGLTLLAGYMITMCIYE
jgi:hypothetical protein